jgi:hypothetical protein
VATVWIASRRPILRATSLRQSTASVDAGAAMELVGLSSRRSFGVRHKIPPTCIRRADRTQRRRDRLTCRSLETGNAFQATR